MAILLLVVAMLVSLVTVSIVQGMIVFQLKKCAKLKPDPGINAHTGLKVYVVVPKLIWLCAIKNIFHRTKSLLFHLPLSIVVHVHTC